MGHGHGHGPDRTGLSVSMSEIFYVRDFLFALMLATSLVNSGQNISNIGPCPNCPADTVPDMDFRTSRVRQKSPGQRPCTTLGATVTRIGSTRWIIIFSPAD